MLRHVRELPSILLFIHNLYNKYMALLCNMYKYLSWHIMGELGPRDFVNHLDKSRWLMKNPLVLITHNVPREVFIAFVRKHYIPEGLKYSIQRSKNKKNENHEVGSFSDLKMSKIMTISGDFSGQKGRSYSDEGQVRLFYIF